jgi:methyl-accepting chemotaxis protein
MTTHIATALAHGPVSDTAGMLVREVRAKLGDVQPVLLVLFASTAQPLEALAPLIAKQFPTATLLGASTAGEFTEEHDAKKSATLFALAGDYRVFANIGEGLKGDPERAIAFAVEGLPYQVHGYPHRTALLLLDPLAGNGEESTLIAASQLGDGIRLAGGAAGDDLAMKATYVACGARAATNAAVVAVIFSKHPLGVGVCHGHEPLSPPLKVTRAQGNVVHEIDGRPAWNVWLEQTGRPAPAAAEEGSFLLRYEAGLAAGASYKIRAPLSRLADGSIAFACGIPQGAVIRITESVPERQIASAREAARRARAQLGGQPPAGALVFDCICRNLILQADFGRAVRGIADELGGVPLAGFETYGEIALDAGDMSGFHNTTSVVLAFPR